MAKSNFILESVIGRMEFDLGVLISERILSTLYSFGSIILLQDEMKCQNDSHVLVPLYIVS